ncbi:MAG: SDR family NAD(P)-dependent oxidoreductase, partial [Planctomycetaceae bacterium]
MLRINNKVAVVTGGADGIGKATCVRFAAEGAAVVIADINAELGRKTAAEITSADGKALF